MSYYLKYRPQTVAELDLKLVRQGFERILSSGEFSHAYFFYGPKGTGKTSSARILAKILNCEKNAEQLATNGGQRMAENKPGSTSAHHQGLNEPCGACEGCVSVTRGTNLSVMEMDAASNRGIDDIRLLRERIGLAPVSGLFNIYVIDEVHMLTTEAFNALLKTLEEPPEHAVFVLCTTEPHKVPETVKSRCITVAFARAGSAEIIHSLNKAIEGEKLRVEEQVKMVIAARSDGSFRDAMKLLEQGAQESKTISREIIDRLTGFGAEYEVGLFIQSLLNRDVRTSLNVLAEKEALGVDMSVFGARAVEEVRRLLIEKVMMGVPDTGITRSLESNKSKENPAIEEQEQIKKLALLAEALSRAVLQIKTAVIATLPLEITAVEWGLGGEEPERVERETRKDNKMGEELSSLRPVYGELGQTAQGKPVRLVYSELGQTAQDPERVKAEKDRGIEKDRESVKKTIPLDLEEIKKRWGEVMLAVKPLNHSLEALLRAAVPIKTDNDWLIIEVRYAFHKEQLEQERYRRMVEEKVGEVIGKPVKIKFTLGKKGNKTKSNLTKEVVNVTGKVEDEELAMVAEKIFS